MSTSFWTIPREWQGEPVFIIGGGPSIKEFDFTRLRGRGRIIGINDAYKRLADLDLCYWSDRRWLDWNYSTLWTHTGKYKVSKKWPHIETGCDVKVVRNLPFVWSDDQDRLGCWDGGSAAVNLAALMGASAIVLLGFDMSVGNWHDNHKGVGAGVLDDHVRQRFIPTFEMWVAPALKRLGITCVNTNPESNLKCFPFMGIEEILKMSDPCNNIKSALSVRA